jgi:hypothetical protein
LVSALEYGGASAAAILPLVLQLGKNVSPEEYSSIIIGPLCKLFASPDRGTRMALLDHLSDFSEKLDKKIVADKIWPHLVICVIYLYISHADPYFLRFVSKQGSQTLLPLSGKQLSNPSASSHSKFVHESYSIHSHTRLKITSAE